MTFSGRKNRTTSIMRDTEPRVMVPCVTAVMHLNR